MRWRLIPHNVSGNDTRWWMPDSDHYLWGHDNKIVDTWAWRSTEHLMACLRRALT